MIMTFMQYIDNPLGKENAVFSNRNMYKQLYTDKLSKLLVREVGKTTYTLLYDKKTDRYFVYFKIPSEVIKDFYYDTVIEFYTTSKLISVEKDLKNYNVKFYSNDPSFNFTFAYAFNKQNLLIDDLKSKLPTKCLKERAVEKNPKALIGYVKSIYFSFLLMKRYNLFNKIYFKTQGEIYDKSKLLNRIMDGSKKIDLRIEAGKEVSKNKGIQNKKARNMDRTDNSNMSKSTSIIGRVKSVPIMKKSNFTKSAKITKKAKRRKRF